MLLWQYEDLVQLTRGVASAEDSTQHLPRETPEGGFEDGAAIKADIDTALMQLDPVIRRVVVDYYIKGFAAVEVAAHLRGSNRWFVDRARHEGIRQMALSLAWVPPQKTEAAAGALVDLVDEELRGAQLRDRMALVVARAFNRCPKFGPKGYRCPVLACEGSFDQTTGEHLQALDHAA